jgi:heat shock protein HslJ
MRGTPWPGLVVALLAAAAVGSTAAARQPIAPRLREGSAALCQGAPASVTATPCDLLAGHVASPGRVLLANGTPQDISGEADGIVGTAWRWRGTTLGDGSEITPADPAGYTLLLEADGTLQVRADCNRYGGRYTLDGGLRLEITHGTRAACPPESLEADYLRQLGEMRAALLEEGDLVLDLRGGGTMRFGE